MTSISSLALHQSAYLYLQITCFGGVKDLLVDFHLICINRPRWKDFGRTLGLVSGGTESHEYRREGAVSVIKSIMEVLPLGRNNVLSYEIRSRSKQIFS